jgi:hypothetical protein
MQNKAHSARAIVNLVIATDDDTWQRLDDALQPLRDVTGVEKLVIKQRLDKSRWATVQLHLAGRDKGALRRLYNRVTKVGGQPPLQLRSRTCTLNQLFD